MAEGRRREQWNHTAHLLAELMNGPRRRKDKQSWSAQGLNPYAVRDATPVERVTPREFVWSAICSML